jgi:hypothetical protein
MADRDEIFIQHYTKPRPFEPQSLPNSSSVFDRTTDSIRSKSVSYSPDRCNFSFFPGFSFTPSSSGLTSVYNETPEQLFESFCGSRPLPSVSTMKSALSADYLSGEPIPQRGSSDIVDTVLFLFGISCRKVSPFETPVDLDLPHAKELVTELAVFVSSGLKFPMSVFSGILADHSKIHNPFNLYPAIVSARAKVSEDTDLRWAADFVLNLLQSGSFSALMRYYAGFPPFCDANYYLDAPIRDGELCLRLAAAVERLEKTPYIGHLTNVRPFARPLSADRYCRRIDGAVQEYLSALRGWLLLDLDVDQLHLKPLAGIVKIVLTVLLTLETGEVASMDAALELFAQIRKSANPHPTFGGFAAVFDAKDLSSFPARKRILVLLAEMLTKGIFAYLPLLVLNLPPTKGIVSPCFWADPVACVKIAYPLLHLRDIRLPISSSDFITAFDAL